MSKPKKGKMKQTKAKGPVLALRDRHVDECVQTLEEPRNIQWPPVEPDPVLNGPKLSYSENALVPSPADLKSTDSCLPLNEEDNEERPDDGASIWALAFPPDEESLHAISTRGLLPYLAGEMEDTIEDESTERLQIERLAKGAFDFELQCYGDDSLHTDSGEYFSSELPVYGGSLNPIPEESPAADLFQF